MGVAAAATSHASGSRKSSKGSKDSLPNVEDTPIRLAVTFAPSRARIMGSQSNYIFNRQPRRMSDCLYVMANHGVLLEYALDPIPDSSKNKRNSVPKIYVVSFIHIFNCLTLQLSFHFSVT